MIEGHFDTNQYYEELKGRETTEAKINNLMLMPTNIVQQNLLNLFISIICLPVLMKSDIL
jgi:hypothetical protein